MTTRPELFGWRRAAATAVALGLATTAVAGCSDDDPDSESADRSGASEAAPSGTASSSDASGDASATPTDGSSSSAGGGATGQPSGALVAAGRTAEKEVDGSRVVSIETEAGGWEVEVATEDGTESEMDISPDGAQVTRGPREKKDDAEDERERRQELQAATVDFEAAHDQILEEFPDGTVTELNLDDESGRTIWEADVLDASNRKHEVDVDAASGDILQQQADD